MTDNELLTLAEREAQRLSDENDHGASIIMRELMERLRQAKAEVRDDHPARHEMHAGERRHSVVASYIPV